MEAKVTLRDGSLVVIRHMQRDDVQASFDFFQLLSAEDRKYLRVDVTQWEFVEARVQKISDGRVERLVAVHEQEIVGDGALELTGHGWGENIGELRLIVASRFQRTGLGTKLARELLYLAAERKLDRIVARMMAPQVGAQRMLRRIGFRDEFLIPAHVRDQSGIWQDLIIMRCPLEDLWREMELELETTDWQRHR